MAELNQIIHEVCEYEGSTMTHIFSFKPGGFQFQLGMDQNGYIYQVLMPPPRLIKPIEAPLQPVAEQQLIDTF